MKKREKKGLNIICWLPCLDCFGGLVSLLYSLFLYQGAKESPSIWVGNRSVLCHPPPASPCQLQPTHRNSTTLLLGKELDETSRPPPGGDLSAGEAKAIPVTAVIGVKPSVPHHLPWWLWLWELSWQKNSPRLQPREPYSQSFRKLGWNRQNKSLSKDRMGQEAPAAWKSLCVFQRLAEQRPTHGYFGKNRKV